MKIKYIDVINYENKNFEICGFFCSKFQGLGFIINTDPSIMGREKILIEFNFLWFRLWINLYTDK